MKSRMTEMVTFGSVRGTYNPKEVRNGFYSTLTNRPRFRATHNIIRAAPEIPARKTGLEPALRCCPGNCSRDADEVKTKE